MSYRFQSDEPKEINVEVTIQISYPVTPLTNNDEYFSEKREESSILIGSLMEMEITDYKLRYCLVIDGDFGPYTYRRDQQARLYLMPGPPQWNEIGQFIVQIYADVYKSLPDAAALVEIITPIVKGVFAILHREKKKQQTIGNPSATISYNGYSVKAEGSDQRENEESANRMFNDLLKQRPDILTNGKLKIQGKLAGSPKRTRKKNRGRKN